jgi:uncharacterized membrane protein YjfL (UPF0719 family)
MVTIIPGGGILFLFKEILKYFSHGTVVIIFFIAIISLLIDGINYKEKGYIKELKITKAISYSYIFLGVLLFVLLRFQ